MEKGKEGFFCHIRAIYMIALLRKSDEALLSHRVAKEKKGLAGLISDRISDQLEGPCKSDTGFIYPILRIKTGNIFTAARDSFTSL